MRPMAKLYRRPLRWTPALGALLCCALATAALAAGTYGVSLFGELKYGPDFKNFDYVNPNAPTGGTMKPFCSVSGSARLVAMLRVFENGGCCAMLLAIVLYTWVL